MNTNTKRIVMIGMFSALAFVLTCLGNLIPIKVAGFLDYDPKDIIVVIAGFVMGPLSALAISVIVALIELVTISSTGIIGCIMNIISTSFFACTAAVVYRKRRTLNGAIIGLALGVALMCGAMMLWNYLITPLYMAGVSRETVAKMLPTVFLPFNFIKGSANAALAMLAYKPLVNAMRRARLLESKQSGKSDTRVLIIIVSLVIVVACVLGFLVMGGVI